MSGGAFTPVYGIAPMMVAPFDVGGALALGELRKVVELALAEGAQAIAVNGLGGESTALDENERRQVAEAALEAAAGTPVIVGATATGTELARRLAIHAADRGAHAVMLAPPSNPALSVPELEAHFGAVAEAVAPTAMMIQDAPAFLGVSLEAAFVERLRGAHANVRYAKPEANPAADAVAELAADPGLGVFGGHGGLYALDVLEAGAAGLIPGCECVGAMVEIYESHRAGEDERAEEAYRRILPVLVCEFQSLECFVAGAKSILVERGVISSARTRIAATDPLAGPTRNALLAHARRAGVIGTSPQT
jgi:4-hydroxy-tetrahydrodipicolinate synthase